MELDQLTTAAIEQIIAGIREFNKTSGQVCAYFPKDVTIETDRDGIKTKFTVPIDIDYLKGK